MREFQEKRQWRRTFRSRYFIVFLLALIGLISHGVWNAYARYQRSAEEVANLEAEKQKLLEREVDLTRSVAALQTPEGIDREIRTTYGLVKPGEELIVVIGGKTASSGAAGPAEKGWWHRFLDLFR